MCSEDALSLSFSSAFIFQMTDEKLRNLNNDLNNELKPLFLKRYFTDERFNKIQFYRNRLCFAFFLQKPVYDK